MYIYPAQFIAFLFVSYENLGLHLSPILSHANSVLVMFTSEHPTA